MLKSALTVLVSVAAPLLGIAQAPRPVPRGAGDTQGLGCFWFQWDSMAGTWDGALPKALRLTSVPADTSVAGSVTAFRATASFYWGEPPDSDSTADFSRRPIWVQTSPDSIEVFLSGRTTIRQWTIRAKREPNRLVGSVVYNGTRRFMSVMSFVAPRKPCDSSVPSN